MSEFDISLIAELEIVRIKLDELKKQPDKYDGRGISIAITHLETAQLWFANARKETE